MVVLLSLHVIFIFGQALLEYSVPCVVFAAVLQFLLLSALTWLLVLSLTLLLASRNYGKMKAFKVVSTIAGWGKLHTSSCCHVELHFHLSPLPPPVIPLLYTAVSVLVVHLVQPPLQTGYGQPHYCWVAPGLATYMTIPAAAVIVVS